MNANRESLEKIHGKGNVTRAYEEIRDLGGFGDVSLDHSGGLDIAGALSDGNTAISETAKNRIAELTGVDRGKATKLVEEGVGSKGTAKTTKEN